MTRWISLTALAVLSLARPAMATLGEAPSISASTTRALPAELHEGYEVRQQNGSATGNGLLREYVAAGRVFAVAWQGAGTPNWTTTLGKYAPLVLDARRQQPLSQGRRAGFSVRRDDLVFEQSGSLRALHGRAYLPSQLPAGLKDGDIHG